MRMDFTEMEGAVFRRFLLLLFLCAIPLFFPTISFGDIPKADPRIKYAQTIFVEPMEGDLHVYIVAEFQKWGRLKVVLKKEEADLIMRGTSTKGDDKWHHTIFGGKDKVYGSCFIVDLGEKEILWAAEAGDRSLWWGGFRRGGQRKLADRIINQLQKSMQALGARDRPVPIPPGEDPFPRPVGKPPEDTNLAKEMKRPDHDSAQLVPAGRALDQTEPSDAAVQPVAPAADAAEPRPATATEELTTAVVKSDPAGADVTVDGKYMGSTPSTVRLALGDHTVTIEKPGFKGWQRTVTVTAGGSITLDATLEKLP